MDILSRIYNTDVHLKLNAELDFYRKGIVNDRNYLQYTDNEGYMYISFKILDIDEKCIGYMSGYNILFYEYSDLIKNTDAEEANLFNIVNNLEGYIDDMVSPQNIFLNLFINKKLPFSVEAYLYLHLRDMLYQLLHYYPNYIAGYIRKETYEDIQDELTKQGYQVINEDLECFEILLIGES